MPHSITCPTCERAIEWSDEFPYRPFCSERCRLIDLGAWLSEEHRIPDESVEGGAQRSSEAADDLEEVEPDPQHRN